MLILPPFAFRHQPLKALYLLYAVGKLLIKIPWWIVTNSVPTARARRTWTLGKCIMVNATKWLAHLVARTHTIYTFPDNTALQPGPGFDSIWVRANQKLVRGRVKEWAELCDVHCIDVPAYWIGKKPAITLNSLAGCESSKIAYYFHGGAFFSDTAHPAGFTSNIVPGILEHCPTVIGALKLEYRLSRAKPLQPGNPLPAALLDAIAGYNYLVNELKWDPNDIIIVGDSAGANLAMQLARYIIEENITELPLPGSLLLLCPWADLSFSPSMSQTSSIERNKATDYAWEYILRPAAGDTEAWHLRAISGKLGGAAALHDAYISPVSAARAGVPVSFQGFPRAMILGSDAETFMDQIHTLYAMMARDMGKEHVEYCEVAGAVHDWLAFTWHEPERTQGYRAIAEWVSTL